MDDDVVVMVDGRVTLLHKGGQRDEEILRRLLDTHPDLVLRSATADDQLRLLPVSRDMAADDPPEPGALPVERVYVDSQGVPLLVGVQVAPHPPADGNALLRLLDRLAGELPRWRNGRLRERVLVGHGYSDEAELLSRTLDWRGGAGTFWARVESHLAREHVRVVLVADRLPDELARVVEFLDGRLREVELRAVEVSLYGSGDVTALVPRTTSAGSKAAEARHAAPPVATTPPPMFAPDDPLFGFLEPVGAAGGRHRLTGTD
jgi:hypothetical protein